MNTLHSRRKFLGASTALAAWGLAGPAFSKGGGQIVASDPGGSVQEAMIKTIYRAFEERTGKKIIYTARPNAAMGPLKAMVMSGNVEWDVTVLTDYWVNVALSQNLLEPMNTADFDQGVLKQLMPGAIQSHVVATNSFATIMAYNTDSWPSGTGPQSWADFWDVERFPGRRAMSATGYGPMEFALLADGVPADKLYPIDIDRALKKLDAIRRHVTVWTKTGAQQQQLLVNREVVLLQGFANRLESAIHDGAPYALQWNQGYYQFEGWVIPRGAKNKAGAMEFIKLALEAKQQASLSNLVSLGPTNLSAYDSDLDPERAKTLPSYPANLEKMFKVDTASIAEHSAELERRWADWLARG